MTDDRTAPTARVVGPALMWAISLLVGDEVAANEKGVLMIIPPRLRSICFFLVHSPWRMTPTFTPLQARGEDL